MWFSLAIISSTLLGFYDVSKKHALRDNAVLPVLFFATLIGSLYFLIVLAAGAVFPVFMARQGMLIPPFTLLGHLQIFGKALLVASSWLLMFYSLKHLPLSIVAPIRSSAPAWTLLGATLFFGERLSSLQWLGVGITFGSYYALAWVGRKEQIYFSQNRWVGFAICGTLLGAVSALYDKYLILRYPPLSVQCWFYGYLVLLLGSAYLFVWFPRRRRVTPFRWIWSIPAIGLLLAAADFVYFRAVAEPGAMISLISVVRRSSVVVAFLVGAAVFRERNRRSKAFAVAGIVTGILLIAWSRH